MLVQNVSLSPGRRRRGSPHDGQAAGNLHFGLRRGRDTRAVAHRADDLGNDVSRLSHDDQIPGPDVLGGHLVLVVQRRHAHGRPPDEDGLELCERCRPPGPPDGYVNGDESRRALLGWEFERDGPARRPRRGPEGSVQGQVVHLGHHTVDLVGQRMAVLLELAAAGHDLFDPGDPDRQGTDRETRTRPGGPGWRSASTPGHSPPAAPSTTPT